ncbi:MAG: BlaI/MecI/CopY family transcriptional regulator [Bacteroides sp.]|nr:BlaI/MecI/CopY family transcriptional regulator [Bacteroides sp.]
MKAGRKQNLLTEKEAFIMNALWDKGPLFVREILALYPDPQPHFNTVATTVRILETKGYVSHEEIGPSHRFFATARKEDFREKTLASVIKNYFGNSYKNIVSALAEEEKISADDLREILEMIEKKQ